MFLTSPEDKLKVIKRTSGENFGDRNLNSAAESVNQLQRALDIQLRCAKVGFDWPEVQPVFDKVLQ
jgi:ATP diphosphatase